MTTQIQRRRGTTTEHGSFTGAVGEITIDTTKDIVVVHDGSTAGGHPLAKENNPTFTGNATFGGGACQITNLGNQQWGGVAYSGNAGVFTAVSGVVYSCPSGSGNPAFAAYSVGNGTPTTTIKGNGIATFGTEAVVGVRDSQGVFITSGGAAESYVNGTRVWSLGSNGSITAGGIQVTENLSPTSGSGVEILKPSSTSGLVQAYNRSGSAWLDLLIRGNTLQFSANNSERMRLDSSGNLFIGGTTAASADIALNANGTATFAADATINSHTVGRGAGNVLSNTAYGYQSLNLNSTGSLNAATGYRSLYSNTTGYSNTATGTQSMYSNTTGGNNVANGYQSLFYNTTGIENTAVGGSALRTNTSGLHNVSIGCASMYANTTGNFNTATGHNALRFNTSGTNNVSNGYKALYSNTTGTLNVANGCKALYLNTTGYRNTADGHEALYSNTTAYQNTANGYYALRLNTTGYNNTATGAGALYTNTTGHDNVVNGVNALYSNTTGHSNTASGNQAMYSNTTGANNVASGYQSLYNNTTGDNNIGIGFRNSSGYHPVFNPTTEDNRLVLGHTSITNAYVKVAWTVTSDERDKMNFAPVPYGLDFVNQLKPTAYQFKVDRDTETPNSDVRYGFKAQDILALEGDNPVIIDTEDADHLKYKGEHLVPVLVNAVQELTAMVKELQAEIKTLKG